MLPRETDPRPSTQQLRATKDSKGNKWLSATPACLWRGSTSSSAVPPLAHKRGEGRQRYVVIDVKRIAGCTSRGILEAISRRYPLIKVHVPGSEKSRTVERNAK